MRIAVCQTGLGNVRSVVRAIERACADAGRTAEVRVTPDPDEVRTSDVVVVPGQGAFGAFARAMEGGLGEALVERIRAGAPYLGICLGLQVLFEESEEAEGARGLAVLPGRVRRLRPGLDPATGRPHPLPHMGWNAVEPRSRAGAGAALPERAAHFYFAHSYAAAPDDPSLVAGVSVYGEPFAAAVAKDNVLGIQFHPEKSQREGLHLLSRFFDAALGGS